MYKAKTTFTGWKLGLENPNLYIGIPVKYFFDNKGHMKFITASYQGVEKTFEPKNSVLDKKFNDRFIPGSTYTLLYFLWEKVEEGDISIKE